MEVLFGCTQGVKSSSHTINKIRFVPVNGVIRETNKERVELLLGSNIFKRGVITPITDLDAIEEYLSGKEPDLLSIELLKSLPDAAILELAFVANTDEQKRVMIARTQLKNKPVSNAIKDVLKKYEGKTVAVLTNFYEKALEEGKINKGERGWHMATDDSGWKSNKKELIDQYCFDLYN